MVVPHLGKQLCQRFAFIGKERLSHIFRRCKVLLICQEHILDIQDTDNVVQIFFVYRHTGKTFFPYHFHKFRISGFGAHSQNVRSGCHGIPCFGITKVYHVIHHGTFFLFQHTFLMAYIQNGTQFRFCDQRRSFIGIASHHFRKCACNHIQNRNHRCENPIEKRNEIDNNQCHFFCFLRRNGFWCNFPKDQNDDGNHCRCYPSAAAGIAVENLDSQCCCQCRCTVVYQVIADQNRT